jgi:galactokinase
MISIEKIFRDLFKEEPVVVRSPGRLNLIGEHTDYNMGFVLPAAIDKAIYFAITPRCDNYCKLFAVDLNDSHEFTTDKLIRSGKGWPNYLIGVVDQLIKSGYNINGFNCVFGGDIPIGAGLSSSAAIEAGLIFSLDHIFDLGIDKLSLVKMAQKSENEFVGVNCGIMDQYINIFGETGNALRIDCRSLENELVPFDYKNISVVLFNTNVSHSLASSEYNKRRKECNTGVEVIQKEYPGVQSLRDVSTGTLDEFKLKLDPVIFKRCKYIVGENERLLKACEALKMHDLETFGKYLYETHKGLSSDYEVSCKELDYLVELTKDKPAVYGARMMGGGFGGCTINLIETNEVGDLSKKITQSYNQKFNLSATTIVTKIGGGTRIIKLKTNALP